MSEVVIKVDTLSKKHIFIKGRSGTLPFALCQLAMSYLCNV